MENSSKNNDSSSKYSKRVLFNSITFNSKLFLKLATPYIDPSIVCIQTLRYEPENRKLSEIEKAIPWLTTIPYLNSFINLKETPESSHKLFIELAWILFYKYYRKNIVLKKAAEHEEFFYILLGGNIIKLNIIYERESLTLEEYLVYLFKMKLTREKEIINKCRLLNSFYADINGDNLYKFCKDNPQFNYEKLREIAKSEILDLGFKLEDFQEDIHNNTYIYSIENYMKIASVKKNKRFITEGIKATPKFYLGRYVIAGYVRKGQHIGNLTKEIYNDSSTYICIDNCDIAFLNKKKSVLKNLCKLVIEKKRRILSDFKNDFYLLNKISDNLFYNEIVPYFEYKHFHQGEKIFIQGSLYEGIFLMKEGKVKIYLNSSVNDIGNYISNIQNSLCGFKEYVSKLNIDKSHKYDEEEIIRPKIFNDKKDFTKEKNDILNEVKKYEVLTIDEYSIFGTNELFDYKTGIYYFTAECISKEALIYFLPKQYFYLLLMKEKPIYLSLAETVESKVKYIIGKLKYHINIFEQFMIKKYKKHEYNKRKNSKLNEINNYTSIKIFRRNNLTINDNTSSNKKTEPRVEFPPLIKEKEKRNINSIFLKTMSSFPTKNKMHASLRDRIIMNKYKKINLKESIDPKDNNLYNKKGKSFDGKFFLSETLKRFQKSKLHLPRNFPFKVQNSFFNSAFISKKKSFTIKMNLLNN
jgi:CRP-like cAMP-binding protein